MKNISLFSVWGGTPRTTFAVNEDCINVWNSTPLIGESVSQTQTLTSFLSSKARGVSCA
jgi:hypothetical protein